MKLYELFEPITFPLYPNLLQMKTIYLLLLISISTVALSQNQMVKNGEGNALISIRYTGITGSPYLQDTFGQATVLSSRNGKAYTYDKARFDIHRNQLEYLDAANKLLSLDYSQISEFKLDNRVFKANFPAIDENTAKHFYEVLYDGNIKLLKSTKAKIVTETVFGNVTQTSRFETETTYFVFHSNKMTKLKKKKASLLEALPNAQHDVGQFIEQNHLNTSNEIDLIKIISFYDTMTP